VNHDDIQIVFDLFAFGRALAYAATIVLVGSCVFAALIPSWRLTEDDDTSLAARALANTWRIAAWAPVILFIGHLIRGYAQVRSFLDPIEPFTWDAAQPILLQTTWGKGWLAQLAAALVAAPLAWLAPRRPAIGLSLAGTGALAVAITSPLTGHAVEHPWGAMIGVGLHALHILGGGLWLGTLVCLAWAALKPARAGDAVAVARAVNAFSPIALIGAGLAVTAGVLLGVAYVGSIEAVFGTPYGLTLFRKTVALCFTAAVGFWNWKWVTPKLGTPSGTTRLKRSATVELLIGAIILVLTALLVYLPAPKI
jgi:putative copper export protein